MAQPKTTSGSRSRPILRKAVPRERLFKQLDRFQEGPVIWVSGPGACGKTTLVSSYQQERGIPSLWYQTEEADKDLATFFYHLGIAFKDGFPKRKKTLPPLTLEYLQGIPTFARRFFREAFAQLKPGMMLVLDNFQLIPEDSRVQEILRLAVSEIPPGNHLDLIVRKVCCRRLGLRAEGLSLSRRFEKRLKAELGIEPAVRTRGIQDSLLGGDGR
jgi:LuxR family transcriptional regulator, maltose regulon positive regulatory protein